MIFGSKKNQSLTEDISRATRETLAMVENQHGVPSGFWQDSYVLGYMMGQILSLIHI